MADLTIYFASTGAAPHDCAYAARWEDTSAAAHLTGPTTKGTSAIAGRSPYRVNGQTYGLGGQWVSPAITPARDWTTADTFDIVSIVRDQNNPTTSFTVYLVIRIFNAAGDTVVGTLYDGEYNATAEISTYQSRHADGVACSAVSGVPDNYHIVVEVGNKGSYAGSVATNLIVGEGTAGASALALNDTETDVDKYSWIAFTYGAGAAPQTISGAGGIASAEAFGDQKLNPTIKPSGIPTGEAFGTLVTRLNIKPSGIPTGEAMIPTAEGPNLLVDGGLEAWTSPTNLTYWIESVYGTSTINRDATEHP